MLEQTNRHQARHAIELGEVVARLRLTQQHVEAATRAKSEFVANMSHELRTPLNAIMFYSELLQEDAVEDKRTSDIADLGKIQMAGKHLLGLINSILDLSKIEAGKMDLHLETFEVGTHRRRAREHHETADSSQRQHAVGELRRQCRRPCAPT